MIRSTNGTIPNPAPDTLSDVPLSDVPLSDTATLSEAIMALSDTLLEARSQAEDGRTPALADLDLRVERLCATVTALDRGAAAPLLPALIQINDDLTALAAALTRAHQNRPPASPHPTTKAAPHRAAQAYSATHERIR